MANITTAGIASNNKMEATPSMINVAIKDGVAHIPADWIQLNPEDAAKCRYVGVVACHHAEIYGIPFFVFYSAYEIEPDYPEALQNHIIDMCVKAWEPFTSAVMEKQVEPIADNDHPGMYSNIKDYLHSPCICIFELCDAYEYSDPAYGAYTVRIQSILDIYYTSRNYFGLKSASDMTAFLELICTDQSLNYYDIHHNKKNMENSTERVAYNSERSEMLQQGILPFVFVAR